MARFIATTGEHKGNVFQLKEGRTTIGRNAASILCLNDSSVSANHGELLITGSRITLRDLGSSNGTRVNGKTIKEIELREGDEIFFGSVGLRFELTVSLLPMEKMPRFIFTTGEQKGKIFGLQEGLTTIGRSAANTLHLDDSSVSSKHGELTISGEKIILRDLGSSNGTRVNGQKIHENSLKEGDEILFGGVGVRFELSPSKPPASGIRMEEIGIDKSPSPEQISKRFKKIKARREWPHPMVFVAAVIALGLLAALAVILLRRSAGN